VDQEANIILGATFDESLEGIIRVSVVATGIDQALITQGPDLSATEQRISEVAERLRAEARIRATPVPAFRPSAPAPEAVAPKPVEAPPPVFEPAPMPAAPAPLPQPIGRDEMAATAVQPPMAAYDSEPEPLPELAIPLAPAPTQAERAVVRPARMPRVDELPAPAQAQIRARNELDAQDQKRRTLLQRLATVGFGRKDDAPGFGPAALPVEQPAPMPRAAVEPPRAPSPVHAEYARRPQPAAQPAYRPAQGTLDPHGRPPVAPQRPMEDDQLEIPAFLRRQAT
jgi:cell division protein FtsZ